MHRNVPGVLRDINRIVSDLNANIHAQMLSTDSNIGYLMMDMDQDVSAAGVRGHRRPVHGHQDAHRVLRR